MCKFKKKNLYKLWKQILLRKFWMFYLIIFFQLQFTLSIILYLFRVYSLVVIRLYTLQSVFPNSYCLKKKFCIIALLNLC